MRLYLRESLIEPFLHPGFGCPVESAIIKSDTTDQMAAPEKPRGDYYRYTTTELIGAIRNAAVTGHRRRAAHDQLTEGYRNEASVLIVDATDIEPYSAAESRLLIEHSKDVTNGIRIMLHILDAFKCVIAVTGETENAAATLRAVIFDEPNIFLATLPRGYPAGFPNQLTAVFGAAKTPARGGAVIVTPSAAIAVSRAINEGRPTISRAISLGGKGLSSLKTVMVRNSTCYLK